MKSTKFLLTGLLASLTLAGSASAQTKIYITGAPATRKIWNIAISNTLATVSTGSPAITTAYTGSSFNSANEVIWTGGNIAGTPVTIKATWGGSTAGIEAVGQNPPQPTAANLAPLKIAFLPDGVTGANNLDPTVSGNPSDPEWPQFTLSDTFQGTVPFNGHVTVTNPATNYVVLDELTSPSTGLPPAITGFKFLANAGSPAGLANITSKQAQILFKNPGYLPLAFFTGNNADEGTTVYALGRDIGSGARYILLAETGIGTANSASLIQYTANLNGSGQISSFTKSAGGTKNLITFGTGNGGYSSFTPVLTALEAQSASAAVGYFITYVTDSDAATAVAGGARELSWNGSFYGTNHEGVHNTAPTSISEGLYTYWSYLHIHLQASWLATNYPLASQFANALYTDLSTDTTTGATLTSDVIVSRGTNGSPDGAPVTGNYY